MPLVSVIIPAFNAERYIAETLEHVLRQTLPDVEVIVVDDGSRDGTAAVVARYPSVRYIAKPNGGVSSARNRGVAEAQGEWVAFVDSDDLWHPRMLELMLSLVQRYPDAAMGLSASTGLTDYAGLSAPVPFKDGLPPHRLMTDFREVFRFPYLGMSSVFMRRERFQSIGGFDETLPRAEDVDMYLRLLYGSAGYVRLDFQAVHVRTVEGSLSSDNVSGYRQLLFVYRRFLERHPDFGQQNPALVRTAFGDLHLRHARALLRDQRHGEAFAEAWRALSVRPSLAPLEVLVRACVPAQLMGLARSLVKR